MSRPMVTASSGDLDGLGAVDADHLHFLEVATKAARAAGLIICAAHGNAGASAKDNNPVDLVTATDVAVENLLRDAFARECPIYAFVSEESVVPGVPLDFFSKPTVLCDPVDGTTNLVHGFPFVCTSIALLVDGQPVAGVVFNPVLGDMYVAARGHGAWLNGTKRLRGAQARRGAGLGRLLVLAELGQDRSDATMNAKLGSWRALASAHSGNVHGMRFTGSAACNLCLVARGSADAYWEIGIHAWDIAAGILIVTEAGGLVVGAEHFGKRSSRVVDLCGRKVVALGHDDSTLLDSLVQCIIDYDAPRD